MRVNPFWLILISLAFAPAALAARKTDIVILKNGDRLTGEIKKLDGGVLFVKTEYVKADIQIDWLQIEKLESPAPFQIQTRSGAIYNGTIEKVVEAAAGEDFVVRDLSGATKMGEPDVVTVRPYGESFFKRIDGGVDFGYSFTGGTSQRQLNLNANASYTAQHSLTSGFINVVGSTQSGARTSNIAELQMSQLRFLGNRWFIPGYVDFLTSSQQQLDLRSTVATGLGRFLRISNNSRIAVTGGIAYSNERYEASSQDNPIRNNWQGFAGLDLAFFKFDSSQINLTVQAFPSLTELGRFRVNTNLSYTWDMIGNLYWKASFYSLYDNRQPVGQPKDYGVTSSFGVTF